MRLSTILILGFLAFAFGMDVLHAVFGGAHVYPSFIGMFIMLFVCVSGFILPFRFFRWLRGYHSYSQRGWKA